MNCERAEDRLSHITPASVWRMGWTQAGVVSWKRFGSGSDFDPVCSFCGKKKSDGNRRFIAGPASVYICEECVDMGAEILDRSAGPRRDPSLGP